VWLETAIASRSGKELRMNFQGMLSGWKACPFFLILRSFSEKDVCKQNGDLKRWMVIKMLS